MQSYTEVPGQGHFILQAPGNSEPVALKRWFLPPGLPPTVMTLRTAQESDVTPQRLLIESGLAMGLAYALSLVRLWHMPQGGEVSLVMLPLVMFSLLRGPLAGFIAGLSFGVLHVVQGSLLVHPLQFLLDYPLAYGSAGVAGFFARPLGKPLLPLVGVILAMFSSFCVRTLSGYLFIDLFLTSLPSNPLMYSCLYNASYMLPDTVLTCAAVECILPFLRRICRMF